MKKILPNTHKTKEYLDSLPKVYGIFLWAKWGMLECPWPGVYDKNQVIPLVYSYYDANGTCDEYHLIPLPTVSSGCFYNWYEDKETALKVQAELNKEL